MARYESKQRRTILEAAIAVFSDKGLGGATIRRVAAKAGVNSALSYYYFENKQKLFEETIRLVVSDFLLILARPHKPFANARDRIVFLVNAIFDYYSGRRERMRLMINVFNLHPGLMAGILQEFIKDRKVLPLSILQEGIIRGEIRSFAPIQLWWSLLGMCFFTLQADEIASRFDKKVLPWDLPRFEERKKQVINILLSGLAVNKKAGRKNNRGSFQ